MCSRKNLKLQFKFLHLLQLALFLALISIGSMYVSDANLERAYSSEIKSHGGGLLLIGSSVPFSQYLAFRASEQHNTFLLLLHACVESTLFSIQFLISSRLLAMSVPEFTIPFRENCIRNVPDGGVDCDPYFSSDRYAGFHLVWAYNHELAMKDSDVYSKFDEIQKTGSCCGYGPPLVCEIDKSPYPTDRTLDGLPSSFTSQRQKCGDESFWYEVSGKNSYECSQVVDETTVEQVIGGCKYEFPLGTCKDAIVEENSIGCASMLEETMNFDLYIQGLVLFLFSFIQVGAVVSACCLCWKRKAVDVIPQFSEVDPVDPYAPKVKKNFKVVKEKGLITKADKESVVIGSEQELFDYTATPKEEMKEIENPV
mmetsp:Transcript_11828/g.14292  ORF Transcript_11828/g.14292 Transcript_11828/m.14292 type:complete len:369 (+) Transcript_11828:55-1161(+)